MRKLKRRFLIATVVGSLIAGPLALSGAASHGHPRLKQGPSCGGKWSTDASCTFRYQGGQPYLAASATGTPTQDLGGATVRLEARSHVTGERRVILSCVAPAAGGCSSGGSYDVVDDLRKGQKLFCTVNGVGRGKFECGTLIRKR
jgi:hypothetical protein